MGKVEVLPEQSIQYEHFSKEVHNVLQQDNFDGFRAEIAKNVTRNLQSSHTILLGTIRDKGYMYQFGPSYQSADGKTMVLSRIGTDGMVNTRLSRRFGNNIDCKFSSSSSINHEERNMSELSLEYNGFDWSACIKAAYNGTGLLNGSYSQVITPKLQLGGELTWISANCTSIMAIGSRYRIGKNTIFTQISRQPDFSTLQGMLSNSHSIKSSFCRKVSDRLSLATELECTWPNYESSLKLGYEYLFKTARIQGMIDTGGRLSMQCQDVQGFGISGMIDYLKSDYRFGFMMQFMPQEQGQDVYSLGNADNSKS
ncbi:eukaryotic porin family protein [Cryptosporidium muris RN66]|uniref:Eukaryotic porin family protein n=1 Tax=Cryptosporidium muris (strain RN66) TaxID=441375 RepID=B6AI18_CRYMR|nr:eukaryotic porin family protein [Cryptosporidium muris RN66]EEA07859.1 eukaryotic porin family protein [Cryptosporidium muris RN66]|eukprot:XP_002142208.1 eukaryotic porin family protein [Cryptosporidium muris RN66]